jgi:MFS family permease
MPPLAPADGRSGEERSAERSGGGAASPPRFAALHRRNFRLLWIGLLASNVGTWMASTAEAWLVTDLEPERKAFALGLIAVAFAVPMLLLPPFGGAIVDRVPRLRLLWSAQFAYIALSGTLTVLTLTDRVSLTWLMGYAFLTGAVLAFDNPTRQALVPDLVDRSELMSAISLNASVFTSAALVGPAVAGALLPVVGPGGVFLVNTLSYLFVLISLKRVTGVPQRSGQRRADVGILATIRGGLSYIRQTPVVATLLLLSLLQGFLGRSFGPLLAVFARDIFGVGSIAFGVLVAAPGLGTLIGSLGLAARGTVRARGRLILVAMLASSVALVLFATATTYALALPMLLLVGFFGTVASALSATIIQLRVPPALRGRVMSYYTLTVIGIPALGTLFLGAIADAVGVRTAVSGAAMLLTLLAIVTYRRSADLRAAG